eukprot:4017_1
MANYGSEECKELSPQHETILRRNMKRKSHFLKNLRDKVRGNRIERCRTVHPAPQDFIKEFSSSGIKPRRMRPGMGGQKRAKPGMTRLRTVWITKPSRTDFRDDYSILKQIGEPGQFGKMYQCKRKTDGIIVAVKEISKARIYRLDPSNNRRQSLLTSMQAEIDILRRLKHRYIVNLRGAYETKHTLRLLMEECKGGRLFERIRSKCRYPEGEAKPIVRMMCEALFYMHDQHRLWHSDLTPDKILFVNDSEQSDIKIIGFGMSKVLPRLRHIREFCDTPYYIAPETIKGDYSHAADMWSIGVILYVMIFGLPPFYVDPHKFYGFTQTKEICQLILKGFDPQIKKGHGAWFPRDLSHELSKNGMDFMATLLEKDVAKRLTAKEALQHPWLRLCVQEDNDAKLKHETLVGDGESDFATLHQFKLTLTVLFRRLYRHMRPTHFEELKRLFSDSDTNGSGKISYAELEEGMLNCSDLKLDKNRMNKLFAELDVAKAGVAIEFGSLLKAVEHDYLVATDARLFEAFRDLDENESGKIQTALLKKKLRELNPYGNVDMTLQIIDDAKLDNDGTIDYEQFLRALHPDFNEAPNWFWNNDSDSAVEQDDVKQD